MEPVKITSPTSRHSPSRAFVRLSIGDHGQGASISFDPMRRMWEINIRPDGHGRVSFHLGDEIIEKLTRAFLASRSQDYISSLLTTLSTTPEGTNG